VVTPSIVDFLNARLAEDQAAAEAARDLMDEPWKVIPEGPEEENYSGEYRISDGVTVAGRVEEAKALHIARHDPARVLREVAAKRAIIEQYEGYVKERMRLMNGWPNLEIPPFMLALAAVYSNHPDYRKEWAE